MKPINLLFLWLSTFCVTLPAQDITYINYTIEDGLPSNTIYDLCVDNDGFLWIATDLGIARYDGYTFKRYTKNDGLPDNEILSFFLDSQDRLWLRTFNGSLGFYSRGKFFNKNNTSYLKTAPFNGLIEKIAEDRAQNIYFFKERNRIKYLTPNHEIKERGNTNKFSDLLIDERGEALEIQLKEGLVKIWELIGTAEREMSVSDFITEFVQLPLAQSLLQYDSDLLEELVKKKYGIVYNRKERYQLLKQGENYWLYSPNLPLIKTKQLGDKLVDEFKDERVLANQAIIDGENNLWFCTLNRGLFKVTPHVIASYKTGKELPENSLTCLFKEEGKLLIGDAKGNLIKITNGAIDKIKLPEYEMENIRHAYRKVRMIGRDPGGNFYIGKDFGFYQMDSDFQQVSDYFGFSMKDIIYREKDFLMASGDAVRFVPYHDSKQAGTLYRGRTTTIFEDDKERLWMGKLEGVLYQGRDSSSFQEYDNKWLVEAHVSDIEQFENSTMVFATKGVGLVFSNKKETFNLTDKEGLASNMIHHLFIDQEEVLWASTNNGLSKVVMAADTVRLIQNFSRNDGLSSNNVLQTLVEKNRIYALSNNGLSILDIPEMEKKTKAVPQMHMGHIVVNDSIYMREAFKELQHFQNEITFNFTTVSINNADNLSFYYRLSGFSEKWANTKERKVTYAGLASGTYTFEIYPEFRDDQESVWSEHIEKITFTINEVWYQKTWLKFLGLALLSLLVFLFVQTKLKKEREGNATELKLLQLKQRALLTEMNPHFINNCLSAVQHYILKGEKREASNYLSKFAELIRMILQNSKSDAISLEEELRHLRLYLDLEKLRYSNKFIYEINCEESLDIESTFIPSMLIQPLVENAILHGFDFSSSADKKIEIDFSRTENYIACRVKDNGLGLHQSKSKRKKSNGSSGIALNNIRERVRIARNIAPDAHFSIAEIQDGIGQIAGTEAILTIPIIQNDKS